MRERLKTIPYDDRLSAFDLTQTKPCDDRLVMTLTLSDYDWMQYSFHVVLPTKEQGFLTATMEYSGTAYSQMTVEQKHWDAVLKHNIEFDSKIFEDFLKRYMRAHLAQWEKDALAFCGDEMAVKFFNAILENAAGYSIQAAE